MKSLIPNALTALNLILGIGAIIYTFNGQLVTAAWLVVAAMVADGLDGRAARYFKVSGDFGKELDSLCDVVSFGVVPAIMAYVFLLKDFGLAGALVAAAFATCGAFRLARFNVNASTVKGYFMGLPIPAAGCVLATFMMLEVKPAGITFPIMVAVFAYLMVSTIKYPDFKGKGEKIRIIPAIAAFSLLVFILFSYANSFLFAPFFAYSIFGILNNLFALFENKTA